MPRYQCLRCGASYYSASFTERLLSEKCELCESMQFRVSRSPAIAGIASDLAGVYSERAIDPGESACLAFKDLDHFVRIAVPFLREGLDRGERVVLGLEPELELLLCEKLSEGEWRHVESVSVSEIYGEDQFCPQRTTELYVGIVAETDGPIRLLGGPGPEMVRSLDPVVWEEYERAVHEEISAAGEHTVSCLCTYDLRSCSDAFLGSIRSTHPIMAGRFGYMDASAFHLQVV